MNRELFARGAITQIPKILTLLDRNQHSPTYGCFDRNFWHYKIIDFPSGMAQEFVWPLALVYHTALPENPSVNPYYQQPIVKNWVEASILYAATSAHPDGSCDDYFPFERASGAAAFSLLACLESYQLFQLENLVMLNFFERRANWLAKHQESGQLTNHQALIVLCLELLSRLLNTDKWASAKNQRLEQVLSWQNPEGWFQEYEGCDPGYHTLTISCLARIYQFIPDPRLKEALIKAVELASQFIHPDGSYGGEYASRNTYNFFPHGFELVGRWFPEALAINDQFLDGLAQGLGPCYADDHIIGHHTWNYLLAWRDFVSDRPALLPRNRSSIWLKEAGILIDRRDHTELYISLNKGGVFKLFKNGKLIATDTQISLQVKQGQKVKNAVSHLIGKCEAQVQGNAIVIQGKMGWAKNTQMSPLKLLILRVVMLTVGRFFPNLIRKMLQKILIVGKQDAPFQFKRELSYRNGKWYIKDDIYSNDWSNVMQAGIGGDQTSIYVVMSRTFQLGQLQPWWDLTDAVQRLKPGECLTFEREF